VCRSCHTGTCRELLSGFDYDVVSWWCSASNLAWSWTWRPYLGVWLFVGALVTGYLVVLARVGSRLAPEKRQATGLQLASYLTGVGVLWIASDWPIGTLGSGYLLSVHTLQYALYCLVAPPLLLLGLPQWFILGVEHSSPRLWRVLRFLANPLVALLIFNVVLLGSHTQQVIDAVRPSQLGSFAVDMAWLAGGLALWWPVIAPVPAVSRLSHPWKFGYLFISTVLPTIPSAFLVFADYPLYALYELAPRVNGITAVEDQLVAGIAMKVLGDVIMWTAMIIVAIRWVNAEASLDSGK
jgi:cytochrome c oxidase assembly factor CtaG